MKHALWIWREEAAEKNSTARFRKAFFLTEISCTAVLTVSAHHYFKLWVNGTPVGGLVSPASSVFQKHKLLLHYDVAHLLRKGENVLAFTVLYLGGNGQNRTRGCAGLLFELGAELPGGERITISSGKDCRCSGVTEYVPGLPMREPRDLTGSTRVDRSRIEPGWEKPGFQDAGWENAAISPAQFLAGELVDQEIPEGGQCGLEPCLSQPGRGLLALRRRRGADRLRTGALSGKGRIPSAATVWGAAGGRAENLGNPRGKPAACCHAGGTQRGQQRNGNLSGRIRRPGRRGGILRHGSRRDAGAVFLWRNRSHTAGRVPYLVSREVAPRRKARFHEKSALIPKNWNEGGFAIFIRRG